MDWVRKTWDDIKGNAKWAALLAVVSAIVWLMHGLVWWKQGGLLAVAVVIGWLMYRIGLDRVKQPRSGNLGPIATRADSRVEFHDLVPKHESHTKLEVRFSPNEPYHFREFHGMTHHRMGLYN